MLTYGPREGVPILSVGVSLLIFLPSVFVKLPLAAVETLAPASRLRVVAAGPFHNLIFWCLLVVAGYAGIGAAFWSISYRNLSTIGKVVVNVEPVSFKF